MSDSKITSASATEVLADKETVESMLKALSMDSLENASGGEDDGGWGDYGGGGGDYGYDGGGYGGGYDAGISGGQQFAEARCMICGARCGSWGDGPVPTGIQGGRTIG